VRTGIDVAVFRTSVLGLEGPAASYDEDKRGSAFARLERRERGRNEVLQVVNKEDQRIQVGVHHVLPEKDRVSERTRQPF
jgi:hypothetical protein